jgi:2-polyprenyl-6-methoxyphenol hydroxylase-like FAD-dependent oxidoreductase
MIIGGGPGGMTLALALRRAGIDCVVYERAAEVPAGEGHLLSLGTNGLDALAAIGVDISGIPVPNLLCYSGSGKLLGELYNGVRGSDAPDSVMLGRNTLEQELHALCVDRGVQFAHGAEMVSCATNESGATAVFADGSSVEADLIVGADGTHSTTRRSLFPEVPPVIYTGILGLGGRSRSDTLAPTGRAVANSFGYESFCSYYVEPDGGVQWLAFAPREERLLPGEAVETSTDTWRAWLTDLHRKDMGDLREVIANISGPVDVRPLERVPVMPSWHRGRGVLLGDAAATTGRIGAGTALAMESAVVLAKCLRDNPDPRQALTAYQDLRMPRVRRVVKWGELISRPVKVRTPWGMSVRDLTWPVLYRRLPTLASMDWLYGHHVDWDEPAKTNR